MHVCFHRETTSVTPVGLHTPAQHHLYENLKQFVFIFMHIFQLFPDHLCSNGVNYNEPSHTGVTDYSNDGNHQSGLTGSDHYVISRSCAEEPVLL